MIFSNEVGFGGWNNYYFEGGYFVVNEGKIAEDFFLPKLSDLIYNISVLYSWLY